MKERRVNKDSFGFLQSFLVFFLLFLLPSDRPQAHSDESRLANLLRRVSREDDRDRRLATLKQMRDLIVHTENKVVGSVPCAEPLL